jgi:hypothetical protein
MANSNKIFVSPGVYTSEKDLTFVAQSVGVTTLGLAGETLKGPAFEPILITSFDEFKTYFGTTTPEKDGVGNPKYELPYVAKSYLQESNQLFVTRALGLTGYNAEKSYGITTIAGITIDLTTGSYDDDNNMDLTITGITGCPYYDLLSQKTATTGDSITDWLLNGASGFNEGNWFYIGLIPSGETLPVGTKITGPIGDNTGPNWYNNFYTGGTVYSYLFEYFSGTSSFTVTSYGYDANVNEYGDIVVATLRSRGEYVGQALNLVVTNSSGLYIPTTGQTISPLGEFAVTIYPDTNPQKDFTFSFDKTSSKYITKVIGSDVYDRDSTEFPLYVYEIYPNLVKTLFEKGLITGILNTTIDHDTTTDFLTKWTTPESPMVVSEVRGGNVSELFQILTISDGNSANTQVKVTILNINIETGEFDILVRDFYDTDDNMVVLEKYSRCSMNPEATGYVALKIGTRDGEYELRSKYIILVMVDSHPTDAIPAGFQGYLTDTFVSAGSGGYSGKVGGLQYKTEYFNAGNETGSYDTLGEPTLAPRFESFKKTSLGLSSSVGYDNDMFKFKGVTPDWLIPGFHLSVNASLISGVTNTGFAYYTTPYDLEGQTGDDLTNKLININYRKFTFAPAGGFDGWDIYRNVRTNTDEYIFGKRTYISGNTNNGGVFDKDLGNSDYYAYLLAIETYSNPEAIDINVFATPNLNFSNHSSLVSLTIDMIENDRADSLYIINSPGPVSVGSAQEAVDSLDIANVDTNYSATYWPWIQVRDTDNSTQLYLPPTGEVLKNIALTDNVSYPWFAVAGYSRGLVNSIKAYKKLTLDERDILYKYRINPIATFSDTGTIIWGNKTLQVRESALDRINVRRLLLRARKLISAVAVRLLFEQNDEQVRNEFLRLVNPILEAIKKERGLYDFRVTVSNDPEDIDSNTLRGKIYIKPTRSLEFIDVEFIITPTGASFENI